MMDYCIQPFAVQLNRTEVMINQQGYTKLHETDQLVLGHIFENAYLTNKDTNDSIFIGHFYGDPNCGIIGSDNSWCLVGGYTLTLWTTNELTEIKDDTVNWTFKIRQTDTYKVEPLIDPWADHSSVWELDIQTKSLRKIKDFNDYKNQSYTENIVW